MTQITILGAQRSVAVSARYPGIKMVIAVIEIEPFISVSIASIYYTIVVIILEN